MPVWTIKHSINIFTPTEKQDLAKKITDLYCTVVGLPAFYVEVHFVEDAPNSAFIGGEVHPKFAAITINHVARSLDTAERREGFLNKVDAILNPLFESKGMDWEYFIVESSRDLWKMNGLVPPAAGSEGEKEWFRANKAVRLD